GTHVPPCCLAGLSVWEPHNRPDRGTSLPIGDGSWTLLSKGCAVRDRPRGLVRRPSSDRPRLKRAGSEDRSMPRKRGNTSLEEETTLDPKVSQKQRLTPRSSQNNARPQGLPKNKA